MGDENTVQQLNHHRDKYHDGVLRDTSGELPARFRSSHEPYDGIMSRAYVVYNPFLGVCDFRYFSNEELPAPKRVRDTVEKYCYSDAALWLS